MEVLRRMRLLLMSRFQTIYHKTKIRFILFRLTGPVGCGENWDTMGQYIARLAPFRNILSNYEVVNLFRDMIRDDVRIAIRNLDSQVKDRTREINDYLHAHYYTDVNFSIEDIVNNTVIGRYMVNFQDEDMKSHAGTITFEYEKTSNIAGFSKITFSDINVPNFLMNHDNAYVMIKDDDGKSYTCATMRKENDELISMFYDNIISENGDSTVCFVFEHFGYLYYINVGTL